MRTEGVKGAIGKPPCRARRRDSPCNEKNQETWKCSAKGRRGRPQSPRLASAEAKPLATKKTSIGKTNRFPYWLVALIWRDNVEVVGRAAGGRSCGSAKLLAGMLRCLHLCWARLAYWSPAERLGRCPKPHKGRCPLTLQGGSPLDPSARLSWSLFLASSACLSSFILLSIT